MKLLAIVAAFRYEVHDYLKKGGFRAAHREGSLRFHQSPLEPNVVVAEGAIGRQRAEEATRRLMERYRPHWLISAGFAGGVRPGLKPGDLFVCDTLMAIEGPPGLWRPDDARRRSCGDMVSSLLTMLGKDRAHRDYTSGACLSAPQLVSNSTMKAWIGASFPVAIVDMESYWVSEIAAGYGIPHLVVRSVLDPMEQTLPSFVEETVQVGARPTWVRALRHIATRPTDVPKLLRLATQAKIARASLAEFLAMLASRDPEPNILPAV